MTIALTFWPKVWTKPSSSAETGVMKKYVNTIGADTQAKQKAMTSAAAVLTVYQWLSARKT